MLSDLQSKLDAVCDEESFITFIAADREDEIAKEKAMPSSPYVPGANGWENGSIEAFLDSAAAGWVFVVDNLILTATGKKSGAASGNTKPAKQKSMASVALPAVPYEIVGP